MKKFLRRFLAIILAFISVQAQAQYGESIRSGRPGQAIGPFTTGARVLQIQAGTDVGQTIDSGTSSTTDNSADVVIRYGIWEKVEVGFGASYLYSRPGSGTKNLSGINGYSLRIRSNLFEGKKAVPSVGFQANVAFPYLSADYKKKYVAPKLTLMTAQRLGKRVGLATNWGANWNGNTAVPTGFYILNLSVDITDKLSTFVEHYGFLTSGNWTGKADAGFAYLINNDLQLDVLGGYGPSIRNTSDWFASLGISWRTRFKSTKESAE